MGLVSSTNMVTPIPRMFTDGEQKPTQVHTVIPELRSQARGWLVPGPLRPHIRHSKDFF